MKVLGGSTWQKYPAEVLGGGTRQKYAAEASTWQKYPAEVPDTQQESSLGLLEGSTRQKYPAEVSDQAFKMIRAGSCTSDVVAYLENNKLDKSFIIKSILAQFLVINKCSVTQDECYC